MAALLSIRAEDADLAVQLLSEYLVMLRHLEDDLSVAEKLWGVRAHNVERLLADRYDCAMVLTETLRALSPCSLSPPTPAP